ncbi:sulfurtransferase TusA family protein [Actinomadura atramentaria]|uniref:sulfurtransferase TusA family protein n=1 Tax=Actinomadura atramentaria TaxID=1990 RepID=UPI000526C6C6|nr:sulfurtransferase TusA family protein [Actinomadura atramentaria]
MSAPEPRPGEEPVVVDGQDRGCTRLLLELRTRLAGLPGGTLVHVIATDPTATIDLPAWCHLTGHSYIGPIGGTERPTYAIVTADDPVPTDPAAPWRQLT